MIGITLFCLAVTMYVATAAGTDIRMHRVPNWITVPASVLGLAYHAFTAGWLGVGMSLAGFALGLALLLVPWLFGGAGSGNVKLLAALGAWLGPKWLLAAFAVSMVLASTMALSLLLYTALRQGLWKASKRFTGALRSGAAGSEAKKPRRRLLPLAVPVALGTWTVLVWLVLHKGNL